MAQLCLAVSEHVVNCGQPCPSGGWPSLPRCSCIPTACHLRCPCEENGPEVERRSQARGRQICVEYHITI
uniref:Uncharacterized protein n=1 Tax=Arundo donax TaxID=35708 RepID=A0A0A9B1Y0_ARUDO